MAQENVKFLLGVWLVLLYFFSSAFGSNNTQDNIQGAYGDGISPPQEQSVCTNCTICPYTCQSPPLTPPLPPSGYQSYGVPPPTGYANCPPAQPVTPCCPQYNYGPPPPYYYSGSSTLLPFIKLIAFEWTSAILVLLHYVVCV
ncbi:hypothetical protein RND71_008538 [Anisodus tanguticus]|uniref:Uncharacterized protein n=1 Tax=Anisodus tanguticus TaxID=243964 RepID=A0AAE1SLZ6_9SOLA|nr:hypothetical protein RND71_008538 [Anisodus tanguticus]